MRNFENLEKMHFIGAAPLDIPFIAPETAPNCKWIPFNYAKQKSDAANCGVHFFLHDYQFARCWNAPDRYIPLLKKFACVLAPDFSLYRNTPLALQVYNHYRKHWLAAYWQLNGIHVIPTISWSDPSSFSWCFSGEPRDSPVAISTVGCLKSAESYNAFAQGFDAMVDTLHPTQIFCYGKTPEKYENAIIPMGCFWKEIEQRRNCQWEDGEQQEPISAQ